MKYFSVRKVWKKIGGLGFLVGYHERKEGLVVSLIIGPYMIFLGPHIDGSGGNHKSGTEVG